jgi:transcriptional regulator with XRE-family HTH domain
VDAAKMAEKSRDWAMNVKEERERLGLYQAQVAQEVGVTTRTIMRWEQNLSKPHPTHRRKLAKLFGHPTQEQAVVRQTQSKRSEKSMSQYLWQDIIEAADILIALYTKLKIMHPEQHDFYQQQIAIAMFKKQYAVIKLREYERESALREVSKV